MTCYANWRDSSCRALLGSRGINGRGRYGNLSHLRRGALWRFTTRWRGLTPRAGYRPKIVLHFNFDDESVIALDWKSEQQTCKNVWMFHAHNFKHRHVEATPFSTRIYMHECTVTLNLVRLQKRSGRLNVNTLPSPSPRANHSPSPKPRPIRSPSRSPIPSPIPSHSPSPSPTPGPRKFNCERA